MDWAAYHRDQEEFFDSPKVKALLEAQWKALLTAPDMEQVTEARAGLVMAYKIHQIPLRMVADAQTEAAQKAGLKATGWKKEYLTVFADKYKPKNPFGGESLPKKDGWMTRFFAFMAGA